MITGQISQSCPLCCVQDGNPCGWQVVCAGFAAARIVGLDAALHLPLLLVVSADR